MWELRYVNALSQYHYLLQKHNMPKKKSVTNVDITKNQSYRRCVYKLEKFMQNTEKEKRKLTGDT